MFRATYFVALTALSVGQATAQQGDTALHVESYGPSCGPLLVANGSIESQRLKLRVLQTAAERPLLILLGNRSADVRLPGLGCRLLTVPTLALPLRADSAGTAALSLAMPRVSSTLFAQAVPYDPATGRLTSSQGLVVRHAERVQIRAKTLAALQVRPGFRVWFVEPTPGELVVVGGGAGEPPVAFWEFRAGKITPSELYGRLTGKAVPAEIRQACVAARSALLPETSDTTQQAVGAYSGPGGGSTVGPAGCNDATWWRNRYCSYHGHFYYCWTNLTGNPWVQKKAWYMRGDVASVSGSFLFEMRHKHRGSWSTIYSVTVDPCERYFAWAATNYKKHRRFQVKYGTGDVKHFQVTGTQ